MSSKQQLYRLRGFLLTVYFVEALIEQNH